MPRNLARLLVTIATALCAWLVATPARAAAPMCDHRGVSVNAPAPFLESPQSSLEISATPDDACQGWHVDTTRPGALHRGAPHVDAGIAQPSCAVPTTLHLLPSFHTGTVPSVDYEGRPSDGIPLSLDRPPRS